MTNTETAVTIIEPSAPIQVNLDAWPEEKFNRLLPVQTIGLGTDLIKPIIQAITLDVSRDTYTSPDIPSGHRALTKRALDALSSTAGIDFPEERRLDDGTNPGICGVQVRAEMLLPTGRRISTTGTRWIDMSRMKWASDAQANKFRGHLYEHTSSRARNRAIRALLSLRSSYPEAELRKPFAVVSFVPNMDHPDIRGRILDAMAPAIAATYGPVERSQHAQLGPGSFEVPEAPEDDPAPAPTETPVASSSTDEPDWMRDSAPTEKAKPKAADKPVDFATRIRDSAAAVEDGDVSATPEDLAPLRDAFAGYGGLAAPGFTALWNEDGSKPSKGQAHAIATVHDTLGHEAFEREWRTLVELEKELEAIASEARA